MTLNAVNNMDPYLGKYFSQEWVKRYILKQTDEEIKEIHDQMNAEADEQEEMMPDMEMDQPQDGGNGDGDVVNTTRFPPAPPE
jgi:hypothetical protein